MAKGLKGIDNVMRNLNKELSKMKIKGTKGLILAAIVIRRDMDKTPPLIPVGDTGNLRASWFITTGRPVVPGGNFKGKDSGKMGGDHGKAVASASARVKAVPFPALIMGFSANYAEPVHEMIGDINWNRPGSGGKFFESSIKRNKSKVVQIIATTMKT